MAFPLKRNDLEPALRYILKGDDGAAVPLVGKTIVFNMVNKTGSVPKVVRGAATVEAGGGPNGEDVAVYSWVSGDTDTAGTFFGEFEVMMSAGRPTSFPNGGDIEILITIDRG